jgi:hypothetical protein
MRNAMPRVDDVGGDVDRVFRVPVPVVADVPVPRDDLTARYEGVAWAPVSAGEPARAVPALVARAPRTGRLERYLWPGPNRQTPLQRLRTAKFGSWLVPFVRRDPAGVASTVKYRPWA